MKPSPKFLTACYCKNSQAHMHLRYRVISQGLWKPPQGGPAAQFPTSKGHCGLHADLRALFPQPEPESQSLASSCMFWAAKRKDKAAQMGKDKQRRSSEAEIERTRKQEKRQLRLRLSLSLSLSRSRPILRGFFLCGCPYNKSLTIWSMLGPLIF